MQLVRTQSTTVSMPYTGFGHRGALVRWTKRPGEPVDAGEPLGMVEVDIADIDLFAPASGTLAELLIEPGDAVTVGQALADFAPRRRRPLSVLAAVASARGCLNRLRRTTSVTRERGRTR